MGIDPKVALAAPAITVPTPWNADHVVLYQLGLGAGDRPNEPDEVRYVHERNLTVLPTFAAVPASTASTLAIDGPGLDLDVGTLLHVGQELSVSGPLPTSAHGTGTAQLEAIYDRRGDAFLVVRVDTAVAGGTVAINRFHLFAPGGGGFGGKAPPRTASPDVHRPPHRTLVRRTLRQQAALFRLSSDRTPVHVDPHAARRVGLDGPSLQGLCTWGIVGKALIDELLDGDADAVREFSGRFTGTVYPGETLDIRVWCHGEEIDAEVTVQERRAPAMSRVRLRTV